MISSRADDNGGVSAQRLFSIIRKTNAIQLAFVFRIMQYMVISVGLDGPPRALLRNHLPGEMQEASWPRPRLPRLRSPRCESVLANLPFTFVLYIISYIDRANIGFAALQMNAELGFPEAFGFAAGVFFIGYFLFEVPSNLALASLASVWIARICLTWGVVAVLDRVRTERRAVRAAVPARRRRGRVLPRHDHYLTQWFRARNRPRPSRILRRRSRSYVISAPLSTWIMEHVSGFGSEWMALDAAARGLPRHRGRHRHLFRADGPPRRCEMAFA